MRTEKSFLNCLFNYFSLALKTLVSYHFILYNMYCGQIFFHILNNSKFPWIIFLLQVFCKRDIFVFSSALLRLLQAELLHEPRILLRIFLKILIFLILLAFYFLISILWGYADLNRGRQVPNLKGYQATPYPLN